MKVSKLSVIYFSVKIILYFESELNDGLTIDPKLEGSGVSAHLILQIGLLM